MKHSINSNTCPFCGGPIMEATKAEQFTNLVMFLEKTNFTTSKEVDILIRDKVANLMISNFIFMQVKGVHKSDLIVIPEQKEQAKEATKEVTKESIKQQEIFTTKSKKVQKKSSTGKPMNEALDIDIEKIDDVRSIPSSPKASAPKISPSKKIGNLSAKDFMDAQDQVYDVANDEPSSDYAESVEEVMKAFPQLSIEEARAAIEAEKGSQQALTPQRGLTGRGIKRL
jgi:hypothetical protein